MLQGVPNKLITRLAHIKAAIATAKLLAFTHFHWLHEPPTSSLATDHPATKNCLLSLIESLDALNMLRSDTFCMPNPITPRFPTYIAYCLASIRTYLQSRIHLYNRVTLAVTQYPLPLKILQVFQFMGSRIESIHQYCLCG